MFRIAGPCGTGVYLEFVEGVFWVFYLVVNFVRCASWDYVQCVRRRLPGFALPDFCANSRAEVCKRPCPLVGRTRGDGHGVTTIAGASVCLVLCCTALLNPSVGCDFKPLEEAQSFRKGVRRFWIGSFTTQCCSGNGKAWTAAAMRSGPRPPDRVRRAESGLTRLHSQCRSTDRGRTIPRVCSDHSLGVFWMGSPLQKH